MWKLLSFTYLATALMVLFTPSNPLICSAKKLSFQRTNHLSNEDKYRDEFQPEQGRMPTQKLGRQPELDSGLKLDSEASLEQADQRILNKVRQRQQNNLTDRHMSGSSKNRESLPLTSSVRSHTERVQAIRKQILLLNAAFPTGLAELQSLRESRASEASAATATARSVQHLELQRLQNWLTDQQKQN
ncbi:MAG: hypothetical protein ACON4H_07915 [Rubripirellula sp.]